MSYWLGTMGGPQGGGVWLCCRLDNDWFLRAGRRDRANDPRFGSGYGSRAKWSTLWPRSQTMSGDRDADFGMIGFTASDGADFYQSWSPWQRSMRGNGATKFIMGQCKDQDGNALGGAIVQTFLTATDNIVSEVACDDSGRYEAPTVYPSPATHYLVAYRAGSPDLTGATVNTLTGTNRDGT